MAPAMDKAPFEMPVIGQIRKIKNDMHPDIEALVQKLREAEKVLRAYHESRWADWLASDADRIHRLDFYGVEHLLSAFGGMGIHQAVRSDR